MKNKDGWLSYILVLPTVLILIFLVYYPIAVTFGYSLTGLNLKSATPPGFTGLRNYLNVIFDSSIWQASVNSLYLFAIIIIMTIVFGMIFAHQLRVETPLSGLFLAIVIIPWALPPIVCGIVWRWMFHPSFGFINSLLLRTGFITEPVQWLSSRFLVIMVIAFSVAWRTIPLAALVFFAALQSIPVQLYESAQIDGYGSWRQFFSITLPCLRPSLSVILITTTITGIGVFDEIVSLIGYSTVNSTLMMQIYLRAFRSMDFGNASALIYLLMLVEVMITFCYLKFVNREVAYL